MLNGAVGVLILCMAAAGTQPARADASGFVSDDFNACTLNASLWQFVNPLDDASVQITGVGTQDAVVEIALPAGASHNVWSDGNFAPRLMQAIGDTDFGIEAKFDSAVTLGYQMQGLIIEQSESHFIRYEVHHTGTGTRLFAAVIANGSGSVKHFVPIAGGAPIWLRVQRQGNLWTLTYSHDGGTWLSGTTFSHAMQVTAAGPFAGNFSSGTAPAFTARVDYVFNMADPIVPEDGVPPGETGATLDTLVTGSGVIEVEPLREVYYCDETVTLTAVAEPGWQFEGWNGDLSGDDPQQILVMSQSRSVEAVFIPDDGPPELEILDLAVEPDETTALVTWRTSHPATSRVAYGLTTDYELGTVEQSDLVTEHAITLTGLAPLTNYHLQVSSTDEQQDTAVSGDVPFQTTSPTPGAFVSDDFNACTLNASLWQFINPLDDASVQITGVGTQDAVVEIALPAGASHNVWSDGNFAPRLMQAIGDTDFGIEAKFDSAVTLGYQMQGLIIEQSEGHFIRYEVHHTGTGTRLFAAVIANGSGSVKHFVPIAGGAPIWLRVQRQGNLWTLTYSHDGGTWLSGTTFSHAMQVTAAGPFAGNFSSGTAPAFTARVDYVFNMADPIVPEDGVPPGETGATLDTLVTGSGVIEVDPQQDVYYCGETVTLTAVAEPGWQFEGWSGDLSGDDPQQILVMSQSRSVEAVFIPDDGPPELEILDLAVEPGETTALITWRTSHPATSRVAYGLTTDYELGTVEQSDLVTEHAITLTGLAPLKNYHLQVSSTDEQQDTAVSGDVPFQTTSPTPGAFVSDDFNACTLNASLWQFVNPLDDASVQITGVGTQDAVVEIALPAGASHNVWTAGNFAPRLMQPIGDTDFGIEAKFDSAVTLGYQMQGLIIEQSEGHFIRYEVHHTGTGTRLFAAVVTNGSGSVKRNVEIAGGAPIWLRVQRQGNLWTLTYSYDGGTWLSGTTFSHAMQVTAAGPFAGNHPAGTAPAFTARVDYVFNMASPIVPEDGVPPGETGATLDTLVTGSGVIEVDPQQDVYYCGETVTLTAVAEPGWQFEGWSGDLSGDDPQQMLVMSQSRSVEAVFIPDDSPLTIFDLAAEPDITTVLVTWRTNHPATSRVDYGLTTDYELGTVEQGDHVANHAMTLTNLTPGMTYYLLVQSSELLGETAEAELTVTTLDPDAELPKIVLWYDDTQEFGTIGTPIPWINVLGHITAPHGLSSASYSLNGGSWLGLSITPQQSPRLAEPGDFNVELEIDTLPAGANELRIRAIDALGNVTIKETTVINATGPTWPLPYGIDWSQAGGVNEVAQVIDGKWAIEPDGLRTQVMGYDRLVGIGDRTWKDYEISAIIKVDAINPGGFAPPSNGALFGFVLRWPGHTSWGNQQPRLGYYPMGAGGWFRWSDTEGRGNWRIWGGNDGRHMAGTSQKFLVPPIQYHVRMRVESDAVQTYYKLKSWAVGQPEPEAWTLTAQQDNANDPGQGCALLIAHQCDATFSNVSVVPGPFEDGLPMAPANIQAEPSDTSATITWQTNYAATSTVHYGLSSSYELGVMEDEALVTDHLVTLTGLLPETTYHYQVQSVTENGIGVQSEDRTFTTLMDCTIDSDGDGVPDCEDLCPFDPDKIEPGLCGCGVPDTDSNGDGLPDCGVLDLDLFLDTGANNSLIENDALFEVVQLNGETVLRTTSTATNIHSHFIGADTSGWTAYEFTGRMLITHANGGIGVTAFSDYPYSNSYYRLRGYQGHAFHISPHPQGVVTMSGGITNSGVTPAANVWYWFRLQVADEGDQSTVRAKVWAAGEPEPAAWQIDAYDAHANRLGFGTVGVWSMGSGHKYWADLRVIEIDD